MSVENSTLITTILNDTINATGINGTAKELKVTDCVYISYIGLFIMALGPIYFGSFRSVKILNQKHANGEGVETISGKDAMVFPLIASCALFGIFLIFKFFSKEYVNLLLAFYFFLVGIFAIAHMINPFFKGLLPSCVPNFRYKLCITQEAEVASDQPESNSTLLDFSFERKDFIGFGLAVCFGVWYLIKKHWIANNLFGLAFSLNAVELLHLNKIKTGCILLGGLFFYDIFWVFATDVMVTVAKSFDAPIKLVFPRDLLTNGLNAKNFAMLGLGDIVIPGIFISLLLRFDQSIRPGSQTYFKAGFLAYIFGLLLTMGVMHVFNHAQPALLYLVPSCLGIPIILAFLKGDFNNMLDFDSTSSSATKSD